MTAVWCGWRCGSRREPPPTAECRGAVTAEFAVALPSVVLLLALLLAGSAAGVTQLRVEEAARGGARALARGAGAGEVGEIVRRLAGDTAGAEVTVDGDWHRVTVSGRVPGAVGSLIPWVLSASVMARAEVPGAAQQPRLDGASRSPGQGT
ncbi:TadE-like protein [Arthrobacter sp. ov407]|uniref:TadE family type IV pilus minor pilin n=1 Tax=Arthrobacter sp. ov407 TaxID=1761748 RepID=UPI00088D31F9|nr:TadE family type IV pilus minor pilin [Arthrobacter sp. ov407]SDK41730.1 TadE-like protein [Arthrobacter sp. ov407]